jgi:hypothetical protein
VRALLLIATLLGLVSTGMVDPASAANPPPDTRNGPPPETFIESSPSGVTVTVRKRATSVFRFRGDRQARGFECRLGADAWRRCSSPVRIRTLPGRRVFAVRAVGRSGPDPTPAVRTWRVRRWEPGIAEARRFAQRRIGRISFAVDVGWRQQGSAVRRRAETASTLKVMLLAAYLRLPGVRNRDLRRDERRMLGPMIRKSDNVAATRVRDMVGARRIKRLARVSGMRDFRYSPYIWGNCLTSARDQASFMRVLERYVPAGHRAYALRLLSTIVPSQSWGIGREQPPGWRLFFKGGWGDLSDGYGGLDHQVALLTRGRWRVGVAILTTGNPTMSYGGRTLRGVAARLLHGLPR